MFENMWKADLDNLYQLALMYDVLKETFYFERFIFESKDLKKSLEDRTNEFELIDTNTFSNIIDLKFENSLCIVPGTFEINKEKIYVRGISHNLSL